MKLLILIPSTDLTGPIKGSFALCNLLCNQFETFLVILKKKGSLENLLDKKVSVINLEKKNYLQKISFLENFCYENKNVKVLSICFSADIINLLIRSNIEKFSSIRGNLFINYQYSYPYIGKIIAFIHLSIQRFFSRTIVMNKSMKAQVKKYSKNNPKIIYNFIDEEQLKHYFKPQINQQKKITFIFIGSLSRRKGIEILLEKFRNIAFNFDAHLHIVGDGFLKNKLLSDSKKFGISKKVSFHGFLNEPYELLSESDVFVLPSYSEGTSRASLEALFLGIPLIIRDVDGNNELKRGSNLILFKDNDQLENAMIKMASISKARNERTNLLPDEYSKNEILKSYMELFNK